ncbi:MAG: RHS repeat-associated core domain-containing protein [Proteobacteria bacterium]|nr:RHS repeat-associated core domain-containing protein [Pseudomonadota bacterium]NOG61158.1 RHS repeat-associated core domain-containing protein [Pseudomonadota bacterium]
MLPSTNTQEIKRLPGQYYDEETNLHYNYFRYYDPSLGRYITSDPIGLNAGPNTYVYVKNKPLRYTDRLGLKWECEWVVTKYYDKNVPRLVQPELGYWDDLCLPFATPTIGVPDPTTPRSGYYNKAASHPSRLPSAIDFSFEMKCIKQWVVKQEEKWEMDVERWMSGYMKCVDDCTGETKNHWGSDRPADSPPDI